MTAAEILIQARALIAEPEHWTKYVYAATEPLESDPGSHDAGPRSCPILSPEATCFCSKGAIRRAAYSLPRASLRDFHQAHGALNHSLPDGFVSIPEFNDDPETTHADVLAAFDRAIAHAAAA